MQLIVAVLSVDGEHASVGAFEQAGDVVIVAVEAVVQFELAYFFRLQIPGSRPEIAGFGSAVIVSGDGCED